MVGDLAPVGPLGEERLRVPGGDGGIEARGTGRGGVRADATRGLGRRCEARERLVLVISVELLPAPDETCGVERPDHQAMPLVQPTRGADRADVRPVPEERI